MSLGAVVAKNTRPAYVLQKTTLELFVSGNMCPEHFSVSTDFLTYAQGMV